MRFEGIIQLTTAALLVAATPALAQNAQTALNAPPPLPAPAVSQPAKAPDALVLYFDNGSANVRPTDMAVLDQASRLYRDGKPIVMVVSGSTDATGSAQANLRLSQERADAVLQGLVTRGIPAERFQVLAKGETDPAVPNPANTAEPRNRRVEITWR